MKLCDLASERAVLGGIFQHGEDAMLDVSEIIQPSTFTDTTNQSLYKIFYELIINKEVKILDSSSVITMAYELNMSFLVEDPDNISHLRSIFNSQVSLENVRVWAGKIRKLEITRLLKRQLDKAGEQLEDLTGGESFDQIVGVAENAVFNFTELLMDEGGTSRNPSTLDDGLEEYMDYLMDNPVEIVGIPSGFPLWDQHIGGGFRRKTVSLMGARTGVGKSMVSDNVGFHVAKHLNIPVLYLDTEMTKEDHWHRILANVTNLNISDIETGQCGKKDRQKIANGIETMKNIPFHYLNISGKLFEETISIMRKWVNKDVGFDEDGKRKDCLIIFDYIKLMNADGLSDATREYQLLGYMTTALHNFAVRHDVPIFALTQLNRDGIDKESAGVVAGSDRIVWLVTNLSIFKEKSPEEIASDDTEAKKYGNRKLVVLKSRHGSATPMGDYINVNMEGEHGRITEIDTHFNILQHRKNLMEPDIRPDGIESIEEVREIL